MHRNHLFGCVRDFRGFVSSDLVRLLLDHVQVGRYNVFLIPMVRSQTRDYAHIRV